MAWIVGALVAAALVGLVVLLILSLPDRPPQQTAVFGKVTYKNEPVTGGAITFIGGNGPLRSDIAKDGSYHVEDCPPGPVKVTVRNVSMSMERLAGDKIQWTKKSLIPTRYGDPKTSGLDYTIGGDRQQINIDLKE